MNRFNPTLPDLSFNLIAPNIAQYCNSDHVITFFETASKELKALVRNLLDDNIIEIFSVTLPSSEKIPMPSLEKPPTPKTQIRFLLRHHYYPILGKKNLTFSNDLTPEKPSLTPFLDRAISAIQKEISSQEDSSLKALEDSVSFEKFKEPMVIVDCGHTFENTSLHNIMNQGDNLCPKCRVPITDIKSNFTVIECVDETLSSGCSVPIPPVLEDKHCDENPKIVKMHHDLAKAYLEKGALEDALNAYSNALKHTQEISAYEPIPELYSCGNKPLHATLSYLYLAKAQLQKQPEKVLETIHKANFLPSTLPEFKELDAISYLHNNMYQKAEKCFYILAQECDQEKKIQEALSFYEKTLLCHPDSALIIFRRLIDLYDDPIKKENAYIRAILYFRKDFLTANDIYIEARKTFPDSPYVILAFLSILPSDDQNRYNPYRSLADLYKKTDRFGQYTLVLQKLIRFKQDRDFAELSEQLIYEPKSLEELFIKWIDHTSYQENYLRAEEITQMALIKLPKTFSLLQRLYHLVQEPQKVAQAASQLGQFYEEQNQLDEAEKFYQEAFRLQKTCQTTSQLANLLFKQGRREESIRLYFDSTSHSFIHNDDTAARYYHNAIQLDPDLSSLSPSKRILFKIASGQETSQTKSPHSHTISTSALEDPSPSQVVTSSPNTPIAIPSSSIKAIPDMAFGKAKWAEYIGDIGEEPLLPPDIEKILANQCPYATGSKIRENQRLMLVPSTINGQPVTAEFLENLVKKPIKGNPTGYINQATHDIYEKDPPASQNYWILITKNYQKHFLIQKPYELPYLVEALILLFMHYIETSEVLHKTKFRVKRRPPGVEPTRGVYWTGVHYDPREKKVIISSISQEYGPPGDCFVRRF